MEKFKNPDGTYDGAGVMSKISGLSNETVRELFEKVKANRKLLDSCERHDFSIIVGGSSKAVSRWQCSRCKGEIDQLHKYWYEKGVEHGSNSKSNA
jgi:hypothetical protein